MKIKVCGLKEPKNIEEVASLRPDMMGFIFYPESPRYVNNLNPDVLNRIPKSIKKVGVFVNEDLETVLAKIEFYRLDAIQLHGFENEDLLKKIKEKTNITIIKAFPIMTIDNFKVTVKYEDVSDYFLFDTETDVYGGSGQKFNWSILNAYKGQKEFILSGGISPDDIVAILDINHPKMYGVDLNSKFEVKPGVKDIEKLRTFIKEIRKNS